jgi:hypothetical protein
VHAVGATSRDGWARAAGMRTGLRCQVGAINLPPSRNLTPELARACPPILFTDSDGNVRASSRDCVSNSCATLGCRCRLSGFRADFQRVEGWQRAALPMLHAIDDTLSSASVSAAAKLRSLTDQVHKLN